MSLGAPVPIQAALPHAHVALERLRPWVDRIELAGSIRRLKSHVSDIEIVAEPSWVADGLFEARRPAIPEIRQVCEGLGRVTKGGDRFIQVAEFAGSDLTLDLFLVHPPAHRGPLIAIRTGPANYSQMLVTKLKGRLWKCKAGRVLDDRGNTVVCAEEEDFFRACQVEWIAPEERQ